MFEQTSQYTTPITEILEYILDGLAASKDSGMVMKGKRNKKTTKAIAANGDVCVCERERDPQNEYQEVLLQVGLKIMKCS